MSGFQFKLNWKHRKDIIKVQQPTTNIYDSSIYQIQG